MGGRKEVEDNTNAMEFEAKRPGPGGWTFGRSLTEYPRRHKTRQEHCQREFRTNPPRTRGRLLRSVGDCGGGMLGEGNM